MSWLSSAVKKVRKATGLPPITIRNTVAAVATGGASVVAQTGGTLLSRIKGVFDKKVDDTTTTITQARQASAAVDTLHEYEFPLLIAGAILLLWLVRRKA